MRRYKYHRYIYFAQLFTVATTTSISYTAIKEMALTKIYMHTYLPDSHDSTDTLNATDLPLVRGTHLMRLTIHKITHTHTILQCMDINLT